MIPFKVLCEFLTHHQSYSWFYFDKDMLPLLAPEDHSLVYEEDIKDETMVRMWYPPTKYRPKILTKNDFAQLMLKAIEKNDIGELMRLKQRMKEIE